MSYVPFFSHGDAATEPPDTDEPPFGWCPSCDGPLIDADSCRCGWRDSPEAYADDQVQDHRRRGGEG